ncbi:hypothetical protein H4R35_007169 [Dimargaris xerosporica]|nr:hypothetical protein H4R35_007169 [Dimargaris xerosporica]
MALLDAYVAILVLEGFSILCSLLSILIVLWVWYKQPSSKESPSFNLTLWIGLADFPLRVSDILTNPLVFMGNYPTDPAFAKFLMWITFFGSFWFIYLNCMITLDLQLVFFHRLPRQARIRRWYPLLGTAIAFFLAFWYLVLPDVRITPDGVLMTSIPGTVPSNFVIFWTNIWLHVGIVYSLGVVIAVCIKVFRSQSHLNRFDQGEHSKAMSKALIRNTRLIIAYPVVLFVVYVPYVLASWFQSYFPGTFSSYWTLGTNVVYASQGIFSFIILIFHPVMLSTYRRNVFGFSSLWSRFTRRLGSTVGSFSSSRNSPHSSNQVSSPPGSNASTTFASNVNASGLRAHGMSMPYIKTMDMGPGVTGFFDGQFATASDHQMSTAHKLQGLEGMSAIEAQATMVEQGDTAPLLDDSNFL